MLHIFLKVTGCLPEALLSSLRLQFLQEYNSSSDLLCTFEFMFLPRCVQCINQHRPKWLSISSSWDDADTLHLGHSPPLRWTSSPEMTLTGQPGTTERNVSGYTGKTWLGAVLFCGFFSLLPPALFAPLFAPPLKEKNPRIWIAWNELNQPLPLQENFAQNPHMTLLRIHCCPFHHQEFSSILLSLAPRLVQARQMKSSLRCLLLLCPCTGTGLEGPLTGNCCRGNACGKHVTFLLVITGKGRW